MNPGDIRLPASLNAAVENHDWEKITLGMTVADVYCLRRDGTPRLFLKVTPTDHLENPSVEHDKLLWLRKFLPVPEVVAFDQSEGTAFLLMTALPGQDLVTLGDTIPTATAMKILGEGLRQIHDVPIDACPFNCTLGPTIAEIRKRVAADEVDPGKFDDRFYGLTASELYSYLIATEPEADEDVALTHGDYCVPNIVASGNSLSGFIDVGRAGIADPYTDIGIGIRSIIFNYSEDAVPLFLEAYGMDNLDEQKVSYYQTVDEFF